MSWNRKSSMIPTQRWPISLSVLCFVVCVLWPGAEATGRGHGSRRPRGSARPGGGARQRSGIARGRAGPGASPWGQATPGEEHSAVVSVDSGVRLGVRFKLQNVGRMSSCCVTANQTDWSIAMFECQAVKCGNVDGAPCGFESPPASKYLRECIQFIWINLTQISNIPSDSDESTNYLNIDLAGKMKPSV